MADAIINFPIYYDGALTEWASEPQRDLAAFDFSSWWPYIKVAPHMSMGKILVDRAILNSEEALRNLQRSPDGEHPLIRLENPLTVSFETAERTSPRLQGIVAEEERAQAPIIYADRLTRQAVEVSMANRYKDCADLVTTAANWANSTTLVALANGSGVQVSNKASGDLVQDVQAAVELYQDKNGQLSPGHLVIGRKSLQHATRQQSLRSALPLDKYKREGVRAIKEHIEDVCNLAVHEQYAAVGSTDLWGPNMLLLPPTAGKVSKDEAPRVKAGTKRNSQGAKVYPIAGGCICEEFEYVNGDGVYVKVWFRADNNVYYVAAVMKYENKIVDRDAGLLVREMH